jgi:hypothetical protein
MNTDAKKEQEISRKDAKTQSTEERGRITTDKRYAGNGKKHIHLSMCLFIFPNLFHGD